MKGPSINGALVLTCFLAKIFLRIWTGILVRVLPGLLKMIAMGHPVQTKCQWCSCRICLKFSAPILYECFKDLLDVNKIEVPAEYNKS